MTKCIVKGCPNTSRKNSRGTGVTLHGFPNTLERIKLWLQQIDRDFGDIDAFAQRVLDTRKRNIFRICSVHFSPQSYVWEGKKLVLRKDAVPSIFHGCKSRGGAEDNGGLSPAKRMKIETLTDGQEKPHPAQWRLCPKTKTFILEKGNMACTETDETGNDNTFGSPFHGVRDAFTSTAKKMVNASTSTDYHLFQVDKGTQWPEYELNFDGEPWKVKHDHFYPTILNTTPKPTKEQEEALEHPKDTFHKQNSVILMQHDECSELEDMPVQETTFFIDERGRMSKSDDCYSDFTPDYARPVTPEPPAKPIFPEIDMAKERKFIVFGSCLDELFYRLACQFGDGCRAPIVQLEKHINGTFLSVIGLCHNGHRFHLWNSQPFLKHIAAGNLLFASAILFSGSSFSKVQEMSRLMGLQQISASTYSKYQRRFIFPTIDLHWQQERRRLREVLRDTQLTLAGDSQHGGTSLSSKHCTYTFIDVATKRILDFQLEERPEKASSVSLEEHVFQTCLNRLIKENFDIKTVATDRHCGIKKVMGEKFFHLRHEYDLWRYAKGLKNRLRAASRKKACSDLAGWIPSITNHLCWSSCAGQGNVHMLRDCWRSLLPHIVDQHKWDDNHPCQICTHGYVMPKVLGVHPFLKSESPALKELRQLVLSSRITKDLTRLSQFYHQGEIKVYHNFSSKYRPRRTHFKMDALEARTKLAILAHNVNVHRQHRHTVYSRNMRYGPCSMTHKLLFPKPRKRWSAKRADQDAASEHIVQMICDVLKLCTGNVRHSWHYMPATLPANLANESRA
ncbi:uncharacterized protein LOC142160086 [Mixophyes fleayi]|uniref:uncharacterized protein LOC142160086 n=1 Tax=Mixophyes fleayi TaxID=3061075 RepID=UPI003F4DDAF0